MFLMFFDVDDLVFKDFFNCVIEVFDDKGCDDIVFMVGYMYDYKNKMFGYFDGNECIFYRNCGLFFILKIKLEDLWKNGFVYSFKNYVEFFLWVKEVLCNVYYIFDVLVLYFVNYGENDVFERFGEYYMVYFVKYFRCLFEEVFLVKEKFFLLVF